MDKELFYKIILFAEEKGFKDHLEMLPVMPLNKTSAESFTKTIFWIHKWEIIFSHEFAKAFWGEKLSDMTINYDINNHDIYSGISFIINLPNHEHYLQTMVLEKDPFAYLKKEFETIK